ncbi:MAG TPA: hypothetical protein VHB98_03635 [Chloroflexota bacterium]|jgi:hypothetical protein|nr:hypothetical protein [Chloroflexota bacterium]
MADVTSTFIIRLWTNGESLTDQPPHGRGRIDHLQSGERLYFDHLDSALGFIRQHFGAYDRLETIDLDADRHQQESRDAGTSFKEDRS